MLVQEAIHSSFSSKEKSMVIKLDMAKAFDRVRHSFLFQVLKKFGFNMEFINWVKFMDCPPSEWTSDWFLPRKSRFVSRLSPLTAALYYYGWIPQLKTRRRTRIGQSSWPPNGSWSKKSKPFTIHWWHLVSGWCLPDYCFEIQTGSWFLSRCFRGRGESLEVPNLDVECPSPGFAIHFSHLWTPYHWQLVLLQIFGYSDLLEALSFSWLGAHPGKN